MSVLNKFCQEVAFLNDSHLEPLRISYRKKTILRCTLKWLATGLFKALTIAVRHGGTSLRNLILCKRTKPMGQITTRNEGQDWRLGGSTSSSRTTGSGKALFCMSSRRCWLTHDPLLSKTSPLQVLSCPDSSLPSFTSYLDDFGFGRTSALWILCPLRLACPLLRHKGRVCVGEVMTQFMPIQTPLSLNATHAIDD